MTLRVSMQVFIANAHLRVHYDIAFLTYSSLLVQRRTSRSCSVTALSVFTSEASTVTAQWWLTNSVRWSANAEESSYLVSLGLVLLQWVSTQLLHFVACLYLRIEMISVPLQWTVQYQNLDAKSERRGRDQDFTRREEKRRPGFYFLILQNVLRYICTCFSKLGVIFVQYNSLMIILHFTCLLLWQIDPTEDWKWQFEVISFSDI